MGHFQEETQVTKRAILSNFYIKNLENTIKPTHIRNTTNKDRQI